MPFFPSESRFIAISYLNWPWRGKMMVNWHFYIILYILNQAQHFPLCLHLNFIFEPECWKFQCKWLMLTSMYSANSNIGTILELEFFIFNANCQNHWFSMHFNWNASKTDAQLVQSVSLTCQFLPACPASKAFQHRPLAYVGNPSMSSRHFASKDFQHRPFSTCFNWNTSKTDTQLAYPVST